jgi:hypothetical protein
MAWVHVPIEKHVSMPLSPVCSQHKHVTRLGLYLVSATLGPQSAWSMKGRTGAGQDGRVTSGRGQAEDATTGVWLRDVVADDMIMMI